MQPQAVSDSNIYYSKDYFSEDFFSSDLDPDLSAGLDPVQGSTRVFSEPSNLDPHISRLRTQVRFFTPLSCDL